MSVILMEVAVVVVTAILIGFTAARFYYRSASNQESTALRRELYRQQRRSRVEERREIAKERQIEKARRTERIQRRFA